MYIKILNKNKIALNSDFSISNTKAFYIDEGFTIRENYNETLDSCTIRIDRDFDGNALHTRIECEPFDIVLIYNDNGNVIKTFEIDDVRETQVSANPICYSYEISLFSLIKELEGVLLPNLSITKGFEGIRTISYYLQLYLSEYGLKIRQGENGNFVQKYPLSQESTQFFNQFECPEMQWNMPTLREVLNDLMMVKDCIPYIGNDLKIHHLNLTEKKRDISNDSHINMIQKSRSSVDYVSELKVNLVNIVQKSEDKIKNYVTKMEFIPFTTETDYIMNTDNITLKTKYPIYRIKHLWMYQQYAVYNNYGGSVAPRNGGFVKIDLCNAKAYTDVNPANMIFEQKEWQTLPLLYRVSDIPAPANFTNLSQYQNTTLHYVRGGNTIEGLANVVEGKFLGITWSTQNVALYSDAITTLIDENTFDVSNFDRAERASHGELYKSILFQIEYETTADSVFTASKTDNPNHKRVVVDNQTNSYVNPSLQGDLEYQKANRLGNPTLLINAVYPIGQTMISIGDYYEDSIVYQVEYQYYANFVNVNAYATKNYILRNYFTGVKARIRSWRITDGSDALTRHDLKKLYCELSYTLREETENVGISKTYLLSPLLVSRVNPLQYCGLYTNSANDRYPGGTQKYLNDFSMRLVGQSIVVTTGFNDNYEVNRGIDTDKITVSSPNALPVIPQVTDLGGIPMKPYRYVDDDGECTSQSYTFFNTLNLITGYNFSEIETGTLISNETSGVADFFRLRYSYPTVLLSNIEDEQFTINTSHKKDNKEILQQSVQFEFLGEDENIIVHKVFVEKEEMIRTIENNINSMRILVNNGNFYYFNVTENNGFVSLVIQGAYGVSVNEATIVDENDEPMITFKNIPTVTIDGLPAIQFYLNVLLDRDKNIYNPDLTILKTI